MNGYFETSPFVSIVVTCILWQSRFVHLSTYSMLTIFIISTNSGLLLLVWSLRRLLSWAFCKVLSPPIVEQSTKRPVFLSQPFGIYGFRFCFVSHEQLLAVDMNILLNYLAHVSYLRHQLAQCMSQFLWFLLM